MIQFADDDHSKKEELSKKDKQILAFVQTMKSENKALANQLASLVSLLGNMRAGQLSQELILSELEKKYLTK